MNRLLEKMPLVLKGEITNINATLAKEGKEPLPLPADADCYAVKSHYEQLCKVAGQKPLSMSEISFKVAAMEGKSHVEIASLKASLEAQGVAIPPNLTTGKTANLEALESQKQTLTALCLAARGTPPVVEIPTGLNLTDTCRKMKSAKPIPAPLASDSLTEQCRKAKQ